MQIAKDSVVQFTYTLKDVNGDIVEATDEDSPVAYLHGHNSMLPGLEKIMEGKSVGESVSETLQPADAYGERTEDSTQRVPVKHLQGAKKWKPGMTATVQTEQGNRQVTIVKMGKFMATVDTNHPLAGKVVTFDIEIKDIREATAEEIQHGHAHGAGGHQHD
ncbi:FKBP-type peptidyl-prolyl cis-trans isomerase [Neptunomonas japonica]|uniref:Peptidyl-prolyl cis-trans isomerase n=1 Tax=Neptunomonas japonica JAMM 1380 TaxID=1441457 RepID=A0A7R6PGB1_9GAMM|nr:peptidylprolyl isomerase [Neptunomonas japonica]BBB29662.1 FKBP-type peptidyl-prolyl cis-trans isomerase SlyD [Neptunomonas japonica JAMM 1380]